MLEFFNMLTGPATPRSHPVVLAMLYTWCPTAARWWQAGAAPVPTFDPLVAALSERAAGRTLAEVLAMWGLAEALPYARRYVRLVEAQRQRHGSPNVIAPELLPSFQVESLPLQLRHRLAAGEERIGGWVNFYHFIRAWAFTIQDWQKALEGTENMSISRTRIAIRRAGEPDLKLPAWQLRGKRKAITGFAVRDIRRAFIFPIEFALRAEADDDVYLLDQLGRIARHHPVLSRQELMQVQVRLQALAASGPHMPLLALRDPASCPDCGFQPICWSEGRLTRLPLG